MSSKILNMVEKPVDIRSFPTYNTTNSPIVILGCIIKNEYDRSRLKIYDKYNPINVRISCKDEDSFFHGIEIDHNDIINRVCKLLTSLPFDDEHLVQYYKERLKVYGLTCEECYGYLRPGIFPLDINNLEKISQATSIVAESDYLQLLSKDDNLPWFSYYTQFNIFILHQSTPYNNEYQYVT